MDLDEVMRTTGAIRAFSDLPVQHGALVRVLERARFAPSGGNRQPWIVIVVENPETRQRVRDLCDLGWREYVAFLEAGLVPFAPGPDGRPVAPSVDLERARETPRPSPFLDTLDRAPVLMVVAAHLRSLAVLDHGLERQSIVGGASVYPFVQNLLLSARAEGLGGVMTTFLCRQEPAARELLRLPPDVAIAALVALGVPERFPSRLARRPVDAFARFDTFDGPPLTS